MESSRASESAPQQHWFTTTHWTVVLKARAGDSPEASAALEKLCRTYWGPLYVFIRRKGATPQDAEDLTQAFFRKLLEKNQLSLITHREGRFRNFLLTLLTNFLSDERDKAQALKRGGGQTPIFLDALSEEERYQVEPANGASAEALYDKRWAETLLERAIHRLRDEYKHQGKEAFYEALKDFQPHNAGPTPRYAELALKLGVSESAVTGAIYRLRRRYAELLREEVVQTVASPEDVDAEIRYLIEVVSR